MDKSDAQNPLLIDQFEFFKTAFLMMIAFYFGDKSLRYLQKRWRDPNRPLTSGGQGGAQTVTDEEESMSQVDIDDKQFVEEDQSFGEKEDVNKPSPLGKIKTLLNTSLSANVSEATDPAADKIVAENKFVERNMYKKILSDEDIRKVIADMKEKENIILQFPVLKSIISIESGGRGHLSDGRTKILFEGHKFWYWLKKLGVTEDPGALVKGNEDILYEKWTRRYYKGGAGEYLRLERAMKIDKKAAIFSTSWGLFQILGENLTGYTKSRINPDLSKHSDDLYNINITGDAEDLDDFVNKQNESEYYHLLDFLAFIKSKPLGGKHLIDYISGNDENVFNWEKFAYGYNGSGYKQNKYDTKLRDAYRKFAGEEKASAPATAKRIPIIDAGHGGIVNGNYVTPGKRYKFTGAKQSQVEIFEGVINRAIAQKLIAKLKAENIPYHDLNSTDPNDMPLSQRIKIADQLYAGNRSYYYMSIHSNSSSSTLQGEGTTASGFEIYTSVGKTTSDLYAKIAGQIYQKHFPKIKFRGVKEADFKVLKETDCPAFLVENLFFDNFKEALYLISDKGQDEIAACLLDVVKSIS